MESEVLLSSETQVASQRKITLSSRIACELAPHEVLLLVFSALFSLVAVIAYQRVTQWPQVLLQMAIAIAIICGMNLWASLVGTKGHAGRWPRRLRLAYLFPLIPIYFKTAELISYPIHGHDFDSLLIAADRLMFGVNPTWWLAQHFPTWPALTEYLQISYALFYFLPAALGVELYRRGMQRRDASPEVLPEKSKRALRQLDQLVFIVVYGFMLSYAGYCCLPAIGPRFTLHNFMDISKDLPGLFLTHPLQVLLNRGENILPGMAMPEILHRVTRDAFPSGHTDLTLLTIILSFQFRARLRWPIAILGSSLIFSTVYLRYHYVVDVLCGAVLAAVTLYTWEWVRDRMVILQSKMIRLRIKEILLMEFLIKSNLDSRIRGNDKNVLVLVLRAMISNPVIPANAGIQDLIRDSLSNLEK